jgi:hypothetical protein
MAAGAGSSLFAAIREGMAREADLDAVDERAARRPGAAYLQYVAPGGSDANDGLSWGTAKATVRAAYAAVPDRGEIRLAAGTLTETLPTVIERTLVLQNKRVTIRGAGENRTVWTRATDFPMLQVKGPDGTLILADDLTILDLTMDGRGARNGGPGFVQPLLDTKNTNHLNFNHVRFYNVVGTGIAAYAPENWKFTDCRFSALGNGNAAGIAVVNGTAQANGSAAEFEANGIKWVQCDFEINYLGRDISIVGEAGRKASNFYWAACKWESAPGPSYAAGERVYLENVDDARFDATCKFIRGLGAQVKCVTSQKVVVKGEFLDGQGQYAIDFVSGGPYFLDDVTVQGSAAMGAASGAHVHIGATANVTVGKIAHTVVAGEARIFDEAGAGRRLAQTRDMQPMTLQFVLPSLTPGGQVTADTVVSGITDYVVPRAGRVVAISARNTAVHTAGTATIKTQRDAVDVAVQVAMATNNRSAWNDVGYAAGVPFAAGQRVGVRASATADLTPATAKTLVTVLFVPDPLQT